MKSNFLKLTKQNKCFFIVALFLAVALTVFGSGRIFALIIYSFLLTIFFIKNYNCFTNTSNQTDETEKKNSVNALLLILFLMTFAFSFFFVTGVILKHFNPDLLPEIPFLTVCFLDNETLYSFAASSLMGVSFFFVLIRLCIEQLKSSNEIKKILFVLSTVYIPILYEAVYLVFLVLSKLSPSMETVHLYYLIFSTLFLSITLSINLFKISVAKQVFVTGTFKKRVKKHRLFKI